MFDMSHYWSLLSVGFFVVSLKTGEWISFSWNFLTLDKTVIYEFNSIDKQAKFEVIVVLLRITIDKLLERDK